MDALHRLRSLWFLALLLALVGGTPLAQRTTTTEETLAAPFVRLRDAEPGSATISFDVGAYAALDDVHRSGELTRLIGLPLPGGATVDLLLRPTNVMADGATAVVHGAAGEKEYLAPTVRTFSATLPGGAGRAFLAISPTQLNGYVTVGKALFFISSGGAAAGEATITDATTLPESAFGEWCGVVGTPVGDDPSPPSEDLAGLNVFSTRVFFECDHQYRALFASDQEAIDYCVTLISAASAIYRRDLGAIFVVPNNYINIYNAPPPWGVVSSFGDLGAFVSWWNSTANPNKSKARAAVSLLTSPVFGGVANSINTTCIKNTSYQISSVFGFFPTPLQHKSSSNWDPFVLMHELGHLYGSAHTFEYSPPINCNDGSGPDLGTIMSYCHLTYGTGAVGMRFHARVQDAMVPKIRARACPVAIPIEPGDYDYDGDRDTADLAELDAYMIQGFVSRGSEETFDMDQDGDVDSRDRDTLQAIANGEPPASTASRGGVSCGYCNYYTNTLPFIGQTWTGIISSFPATPTLTTIIGTTAPQNPGLATKFGKLLIVLPPGASQIFKSTVTTSFAVAFHAVAIPYDLSLVGAQAYSQGVVFTANGPRLTNAVDLVLSVY